MPGCQTLSTRGSGSDRSPKRRRSRSGSRSRRSRHRRSRSRSRDRRRRSPKSRSQERREREREKERRSKGLPQIKAETVSGESPLFLLLWVAPHVPVMPLSLVLCSLGSVLLLVVSLAHPNRTEINCLVIPGRNFTTLPCTFLLTVDGLAFLEYLQVRNILAVKREKEKLKLHVFLFLPLRHIR